MRDGAGAGDPVAATCAAIAPYAWRGLTPTLVARLVLAASDRHAVETLLAAVPGTVEGRWERLTPAEPDDPRLTPLVDFLATHRWTEMQLPALCRRLLVLLEP